MIVYIWGGVTKKNEKIWDNVPKGGGVTKKQKCPNFHWGILKTEGAGVSIFQKCPNFNYLIVYFAILPL